MEAEKMPTFDTPEPIAVRVDAAAGFVRLVATDRADTVVAVRAHDESRPADVLAADAEARRLARLEIQLVSRHGKN